MAIDHDEDKDQKKHISTSKNRSYPEVESNDNSSDTQISKMLTTMIEDKKKLDKEAVL